MFKYKLDWIRQKFDSRDRKLILPKKQLAALSPIVDLDLFRQVPQLNQGREGSCGPNAADEIVCYDQLVMKIILNPPSRAFIYYNARKEMGTISEDSGVDNRAMMLSLAKYGYCPEEMLGYSDSYEAMIKEPSAACYAAAFINRITDYSTVIVDLIQMKGALYSGHPFIFGCDVFSGFLSDEAAETGIIPDPKSDETAEGGHDISFCGFSDIIQPGVKANNIWPAGTFKFRNHWLKEDGTLWGDGGYGYMSYKYGTNTDLVADLWCINIIN